MADPFPNRTDCAECPWRDYLDAQPSFDISQAAAKIVALINSSPRSPRQDDIEGVIANVTAPAAADKSERWREWQELVDQTSAADARCDALEAAAGDSYPETVVAAEAEIAEAMEREDAWARRMRQQPVRNWDDVTLLAAICYRTLWSGGQLTAPDADARMARGPDHAVGGICADALAALLKGIRDLSLTSLKSGEVRHG